MNAEEPPALVPDRRGRAREPAATSDRRPCLTDPDGSGRKVERIDIGGRPEMTQPAQSPDRRGDQLDSVPPREAPRNGRLGAADRLSAVLSPRGRGPPADQPDDRGAWPRHGRGRGALDSGVLTDGNTCRGRSCGSTAIRTRRCLRRLQGTATPSSSRGKGTRLTVAVADPSSPQFAQVRYALEDNSVDWVISPQADIAARVAEAYSTSLDVRDNELERFVEDMIREAAHTRGLSDIHCIPEDRSCEIRWRIDGDLVPWGTLPGAMKEAVSAQLKLSSTRGADGRSRSSAASGGLDVANRLDAQDASAVREYGSKRVSLRYSVIPAINGESIVIRILDQSAQVGSLEDLGMLEDTAMRFRTELKRPNGIILVSGPTGHGKSTTLAAAVPWLDSRNKRVLSVEDPVEYRLRTVTQAPVSARMPFASALRAFLQAQSGHHHRRRDSRRRDRVARDAARAHRASDPHARSTQTRRFRRFAGCSTSESKHR